MKEIEKKKDKEKEKEKKKEIEKEKEKEKEKLLSSYHHTSLTFCVAHASPVRAPSQLILIYLQQF